MSGATAAWAKGLTGKGIGVAVIDSGVVPAATDLGSRVTQVKLNGQGQSRLDDTVGHGTFVADVLAGASRDGRHVGVAPGASVYAINVTGSDGSVYTSDVVVGLSWVLANRAGTTSASSTCPWPSRSRARTRRAPSTRPLEKVWQAGIVVVASSGNQGPDTVHYAPANDPFVITVGASDANDTPTTRDDVLAGFSSYGVTDDGFSKPEIVATGRHIVSNLVSGSLLDGAGPCREPRRARLSHGERHLVRRPAGCRRRRDPPPAKPEPDPESDQVAPRVHGTRGRRQRQRPASTSHARSPSPARLRARTRESPTRPAPRTRPTPALEA